MAIQLKLDGGSEIFVLSDTVNAAVKDKPYPSARVFARESSTGLIQIRVVSNDEDGSPFGKVKGYTLAELVDDGGAPFASVDAVLTWFKDNTGKSKGAGTGTGQTAPQVNAQIDARSLIIPVAAIAAMTQVGRFYELNADESPNLQYDTFKVAYDGTLIKL